MQASDHDLAIKRTTLSEERTFASWIRTALAAVGFGVGLVKLLPATENRTLVQLLGVLFVTAGMLIFVVGLRSYLDALKRLGSSVKAPFPVWMAVVVTSILVLGSTIGLVSIILDF